MRIPLRNQALGSQRELVVRKLPAALPLCAERVYYENTRIHGMTHLDSSESLMHLTFDGNHQEEIRPWKLTPQGCVLRAPLPPTEKPASAQALLLAHCALAGVLLLLPELNLDVHVLRRRAYYNVYIYIYIYM